MKPLWKRIGFYISVVTGILTGLFIYELVRLNMLPTVILVGIILICVIVWILSAICITGRDLHWAWRFVGALLVICIACTSGLGVVYANAGNKALDNLTQKEGKNIVGLYVLNNDVIKDVKELEGRKVGVLASMSDAGNKACLDELTKQNVHIEQVSFDSSYKMAQALKGQSIDAMIMDTGYMDALSEMPNMENINSEVVAIAQYYYDAPETNSAQSVNVSEQPFTVYISGIDTREDELLRNSRSDVNLLATVNPKTHEVLLVSIPRDYYVETACEPSMGCMNGAMDKLTHTGLHGPETTEMTLEKLFGIDINYNVRVNFSSLINVVNELGGITVNNPNDFTATYEGYHYPAGNVDLDGEHALAFVRERYAFTDGDRERGRNQMRVINAIINKMLSPQILTNFTGILSTLSNSFDTNMPQEDMKALVSAQISNPSSWTIYNYSVSGSGGTDYAAELGDNAYVMYPDQTTVDNAKADIQAVINGEVPPYVNEQ